MSQKFSRLRFKEFAKTAVICGAVALHSASAVATPVNIGSGTGVLTLNVGNAVWFLNNNITFSSSKSNWGFSEASLHTAGGTRDDAFDGALSWMVNGTGYVSPSGTIDISPYPLNTAVGTTLTGAAQTMAGLTVTGQIYLSPVKAVARSILILQNPTGAPITVSVANNSNRGSDNNTVYQATSSGDNAYGPTDNWAVTSQTASPPLSGDPIVTLAFSQTGSAVRGTPNQAVANGSDKLFMGFNVTVPAGETRRVMVFAQMSDTVAHAVTDAALFNTRASLQGTDYLSGLSPTERAQIVNWTIAAPVATAPTPVPTLSQWALAGLTGLLGLASFVGIRRRQRSAGKP